MFASVIWTQCMNRCSHETWVQRFMHSVSFLWPRKYSAAILRKSSPHTFTASFSLLSSGLVHLPMVARNEVQQLQGDTVDGLSATAPPHPTPESAPQTHSVSHKRRHLRPAACRPTLLATDDTPPAASQHTFFLVPSLIDLLGFL